MQTPSVGVTGTQGQQAPGDALRGLDLKGFLDLMIAELQNKDPLNPMDNSEMLQQISQIRSIDSTDKLTTTLDAVLLGQNLSSASFLIGKQIEALTDEGKNVTGLVDRVTVDAGVPKLRIGTSSISLKNLKQILPAAS
jgi:flagellar basal-body rod modification protein FlgD